jgi:hypothetical protein
MGDTVSTRDTRKVLFVGGPRHGETVTGQPKGGEIYRVPIPGEPAFEYKAVPLKLTYADPLGRPGASYEAFAFTSPNVDPDRGVQGKEHFGQALSDALIRWYVRENGYGVNDLAEGTSSTAYVAWCDTCSKGRVRHTFDNMNERAAWMNDHTQSTGHTARWENTEV